ncbi:hypothetical protein EI94DRAFT_1717086 [Lactarius quietus]|nr:hypothetical protein EI94DRAFT_1717086 [Lactarius quietus]
MLPKYQDPLHLLFEYLAKHAPYRDMVIVHDDDLEQILGVINLTMGKDHMSLSIIFISFCYNPWNISSHVVMDYLERLKPAIGVKSEDFLPTDDQGPRIDMEHLRVAMFS